MTVFQYLELFTAFAVSTEMPVTEFALMESAVSTPAHGDRQAYFENANAITDNALRKLDEGDATLAAMFWLHLKDETRQHPDWTPLVLQPLTEAAIAMEEAKVKDQPELREMWLSLLEIMLSEIEEDFLKSIPGFNTLPSKYSILAIASGEGDRATKFYYTLEGDHEEFFFLGLKERNGLLQRMRRLANADDVDPKELPLEPRISLVTTYLSHPFAHRLQPFYGKTFEQIIKFNILTHDELLQHGEELVKAHFREGMAYLDLARQYRAVERYDDALECIEKGILTRLHYGNRMAAYQLEKAIIHREAGDLEKARETMNYVVVDDLDRYNRELRAKVLASLREE